MAQWLKTFSISTMNPCRWALPEHSQMAPVVAGLLAILEQEIGIAVGTKFLLQARIVAIIAPELGYGRTISVFANKDGDV